LAPNNEYVIETIKSDELHHWEAKQKHLVEKNILMAANLISAVIESSFNDGYSWCVETIKNSTYSALASEFDMNKAIMFLKQDDIQQAIETLKFFERKDTAVAVNASINLTFIHLMKNDLQMAETYAESARKLDTYNPATYINVGVLEMIRENYDKAKLMFESALDIDSTSFEALYNLGLINKKIGDYDNALMYFRKLHVSFGTELYPALVYQIGNVYETMNDLSAALEWYLQLLGTIESDAGLLQKIAEIYEQNSDRQQSFHYYYEAYRANPDNFQIINWIGSHFIELQVAEKAINIYEKAYMHAPDDPYFLLRVAGIYRRIGSPQKSLKIFQVIHTKYPDNLDCLRALMHLSQTQGLNEVYEKYLNEYQTIEKNKEIRQRIGSSRPTTTSSRSASKSSASKKKTGKETNTNSFNSTTALQKTSFEVESPPVEQMMSYTDPLGPAPERPRTGMVQKFEEENSDDDFNADELLPM
jgi:intraflagellar transport protein 88